ncbi:cupin domain-containing protein [Sinorhizobium fredii]|uniref:cupin domain-containing protein n=1 Tax=Rhizobium fredii TaxID=380 RepID=UPI0005956AEE|nr:cupin domain-containing protein [Sinorhizobium fredii]WOS66038.1 cupin domain-containing protein [Sinorhizobium fredii GR64]
MIKSIITALAFTAALAGTAAADDAPAAEAAKVKLVYEHELPNVPGKSIRGVMVEYGPGLSTEPHTHPSSAFIYATVLEGSIRIQINDGPVKVYRAGENFTEMPGDRHMVSANASETEPVKFLAVFVVDTDQRDLTFPIKD